MKKVIALFLSLIMVFGMVACGQQEAAPEAKEETSAPAAVPENSEKVEGPETSTEEEREPVTLKFYCWASEQPDQQAVFDKLNEYFQEKYNTTVDFQFISATFNDKMSMVINSGEEFDACFTSNWANDYVSGVSKEAFVDITDMLNDFPGLYNAMPEAYWTAATIDGRIYAVPNIQIAARSASMCFKSEQFETLGLTDEEVQSWGNSLLNFTEYLQAAKDLDGSMFSGVPSDALANWCGYEFLGSVNNGAAVKLDDPTCTVVNFFETPEFKAVCDESRALHEMGLMDGQCMVDGEYFNSQRKAGRISLYFAGTYKPGIDQSETLQFGIPVHNVQASTPVLTTGGIIATMWGISTSSKYPERTMEIIELLLTDPYVMNLISYGIEGIHYEVQDGLVSMISDAGYNPGVSWAFGNTFLTTPMVGQEPDVWEETRVLNETADVSRLMGFSYSNANVQAEVANVASVVDEYTVLRSGQVAVEETLAEFLNKMDTAGIDAIIADAQAQVDAFLGK